MHEYRDDTEKGDYKQGEGDDEAIEVDKLNTGNDTILSVKASSLDG